MFLDEELLFAAAFSSSFAQKDESKAIFFPSVRYLHERFNQVQEEVNLLKSNIMKYKVEWCLSVRVCSIPALQ